MKRNARLLAIASLAAITVAAAASCSSSTSSSGLTPQEMQGNYSLTSFTTPPSPTLNPPAVTGTLILTLTNFTLVLNLGGAPPQYDGGTYTISGNTFTENSDSTGLTYSGTAHLVNDSLNVEVTTPGGVINTTWHKN